MKKPGRILLLQIAANLLLVGGLVVLSLQLMGQQEEKSQEPFCGVPDRNFENLSRGHYRAAKAFDQHCASCHGFVLDKRSGPALGQHVGNTFQREYILHYILDDDSLYASPDQYIPIMSYHAEQDSSFGYNWHHDYRRQLGEPLAREIAEFLTHNL